MTRSVRHVQLIALALASLLLVGRSVQADPPERQLVCHRDGQGRLVEIVVANEAAEAGHRRHGDYPPQSYWPDTDGDGHGAGTAQVACEQPAGHVGNGGDCQPDNARVHPGAQEACGDRVDNDCDGAVDEGCRVEPPPSHEVQVLLHCSGDSPVLATYGVGTHQLPWVVSRNISFLRFVGGTTGAVTLRHCDGRTQRITTNTNLCGFEGGCCGAGRWNDSVCAITVE